MTSSKQIILDVFKVADDCPADQHRMIWSCAAHAKKFKATTADQGWASNNLLKHGDSKMGMDLFGHGGLSINWLGWEHCLDVAMAFGWKPEGTAPPPAHFSPHGRIIDDWDGTYFGNDFQEVTETDAKQLSKALYRAIETVEHGHKLTPEQRAVVNLDSVVLWKKLAKYAGSGNFLVG